MSESLGAFVVSLLDPDRRPEAVLLGALAAVLAGGLVLSSHPALHGLLAVLAVLVAAAAAVRVGEPHGPVVGILGLAAAWAVFREGSLAAVLAHQAAYFALAPLLVHRLLSEPVRRRTGILPLHVYAPAAVAVLGVVVYALWRTRQGLEPIGDELRRAALVYGLCYLALLGVVVALRLSTAAEKKAAPPPAVRAEEAEEQGRFGVASRLHEREGRLEKAAEDAERSGEWARAGGLRRRAGDSFRAGEMFYRAGELESALRAYEAAQSWAAAAGLCVQLKRPERAAELFEKAGDAPAAVRALEEAGLAVSPEAYRRARLYEKAADAYAASGNLLRAAEVREQDLRDLPGAVALLRQAGAAVAAGRLLERLGQQEEALEGYRGSEEGALDALRLCLALGRTAEATEILLRLPPGRVEAVDDPATLLVVARALLQSGREDEAVRLLQALKRRGDATGPAHLLLGRALLGRRLADLAEEELRTATSLPLDPAEELEAAYLLGCTLEAAGKTREALETYHGILQKDLGYADVESRYRRLKEAGSAPAADPFEVG